MSEYIEWIAIIISAISLILTVINFFISRRHDRKQATLDAFNTLQEQALDVLNGYTKKQLQELKRSNQDEDYRRVSSCLARVEHFCVGINQGIYDKDVLWELAGPYIVAIFHKLEPMIEKKQIGHSEQRFYANFEKVAAYMEKRNKK